MPPWTWRPGLAEATARPTGAADPRAGPVGPRLAADLRGAINVAILDSGEATDILQDSAALVSCK